MVAYILVRAEVQATLQRLLINGMKLNTYQQHWNFNEAVSAWRGWSDVEEGVFYVREFDNLSDANALLNSQTMKEFIAEFNRNWDGKVKRSREVFG